jgi:hypothetical protein
VVGLEVSVGDAFGAVYIGTVRSAGVAVRYSRIAGRTVTFVDVVGIFAYRAGDRGSDGGLIACLAVVYRAANAGVV